MNRSRVRLLAGVCGAGILWIACQAGPRHATADDQSAAEGDYGSLFGEFVLDGDFPKLSPLVAKGDPQVRDPAICAAADIPDDSLIVDPKTKGIANVFVYLLKAQKVHPKLKESAAKEVVFDQQGCRFTPHALLVRTDQLVRVKSNDSCAHNTKTEPTRNQSVNLFLTANDRTGLEIKNKLPEPKPIEVHCSVHPWMKAQWLILDHPYAAISDEQGKFIIADLPAGDHDFLIWHERIGYITKTEAERKHRVSIVAGKKTEMGPIKVPAAKFVEK